MIEQELIGAVIIFYILTVVLGSTLVYCIMSKQRSQHNPQKPKKKLKQ